jgi:cell volume regulation protein A
MHALEITLAIAGLLLVVSVLASKTSSRYGIPALILFLGVGMLAGSEGIGGIAFENFEISYGIGAVALTFILFAGGLETHWHQVRSSALPALSLATVGVMVTAILVALFSHYCIGMSLPMALLLASIVSSTDAAAVFGVLRSQGINLKGRLSSLLELESGSNDPMAVFLTVGVTGYILGEVDSLWTFIPKLFLELSIGGALGGIIGYLAYRVLNTIELDSDGLYPVFTTGIALLAFSTPHLVGGNGYLAAYVAGITLGSRRFVHRVSIINFHDGLGWLMQIAMFLTLGLLITPSQIVPLIIPGCLGALFLIFVARPVAVYTALFGSSFTLKERAFISWVGLKGAVPIVLATIPVTAGVLGSTRIFNEVFFIVGISVIVQGMSVSWLARKLDLIDTNQQNIKQRNVASSMLEVTIPESSPVVGKRVVELNLPEAVLLVLLTRGRDSFIPRGGTLLAAGDVLLINDQGIAVDDVRRFFLTGEAIVIE